MITTRILNCNIKRTALLVATFILFTVKTYSQNRLWATYYGGSQSDWDYTADVITDATGNVYICGSTDSQNNIAYNGFQNTYGGIWDAYLVKFDANGNRIWATYYGGTQSEYPSSLAIDANGNIYMAGYTSGSTIGIAYNGFQNTFGGGNSDNFLVKFDASGNRIWATYYGGAGDEQSNCSVAVDATGNVYLGGGTTSSNSITTVGGYQNTNAGNGDAYLIKFDSNGNRIWGTYFGGPSGEGFWGITTDPFGNIYTSGYTQSATGIANNGFQNTFGGVADAYINKYNTAGNLIWATYYGGAGTDFVYTLAADSNTVVFCGRADSISTNIASANGAQINYQGGYNDGFVVKLDTAGNRIWATYYGGNGDDYPSDLALEKTTGNIYLCGTTTSANNIANNGYCDSLALGADHFLVKLNAAGQSVWATYYNSSSTANNYPLSFFAGPQCCVDTSAHVYLLGGTDNLTGIATNGFQNTYGGSYSDAYLVKFGNLNTSGIEENTQPINAVNAYPNPFNDNVKITSSSTILNIEVLNSLGQVVFARNYINNVTTNIQVNNLAKGIYLMQIHTSKGIQLKKIVKE
ncbi:MAG: SBBP repeat-containing protein [Bacteroidia bacterium]